MDLFLCSHDTTIATISANLSGVMDIAMFSELRLTLRQLMYFVGATCFSIDSFIQGSYTDWITWKNGETFFSQGILCRLEKSGKFGQNTGKVREI